MAKSKWAHGPTCVCEECDNWRLMDDDIVDALILVTKGLAVLLLFILLLLGAKYAALILLSGGVGW